MTTYSNTNIQELEERQRKIALEVAAIFKELKNLKEPKPLHEPPQYCDGMFWLDSAGFIVPASASLYYKKEWLYGNIFETKEEARRERDRRKALARIKRHAEHVNGDWKPDWYNELQSKYYIYYCYCAHKFNVGHLSINQDLGASVNYKCSATAQEAIKECGDDYKVLFGIN